ncbi:ornithine carbamoyltransferase [Sesbania bispinosa]|nr:ornithine carbamoyltransferase [Sesbania bispinosa]
MYLWQDNYVSKRTNRIKEVTKAINRRPKHGFHACAFNSSKCTMHVREESKSGQQTHALLTPLSVQCMLEKKAKVDNNSLEDVEGSQEVQTTKYLSI